MATAFFTTNTSDNSAVALFDIVTAAGTAYQLTDSTKDDRLVFILKNDNTSTGSMLFKAGDFNNKSQGDLTVYVGTGADGTVVVGPLEGARFRQDDGSILVDSSMIGWMSAISLNP